MATVTDSDRKPAKEIRNSLLRQENKQIKTPLSNVRRVSKLTRVKIGKVTTKMREETFPLNSTPLSLMEKSSRYG